jgi:hypothetical protein
MYKCSVKDVLSKSYEGEAEKKTILLDIMAWERGISTSQILHAPDDDVNPDLVERLCLLRRYEFAARYGDYTRDVCRKLKTAAQEFKTDYYEEITGWNKEWTKINTGLNEEHLAYRRYQNRDPSIKDEQIKTTLAVERACAASGQNMNLMMQTIAMYADRNSLVQMSTLHMIENGMWHKLRENLWRDLKDLPLVTPAHLRHTIPLMQGIVNAVIDIYFKRNPEKPNDMNYWDPKAEAYAKAAQLKEEEKKTKMGLVAAERKKVATLAEKRLRELTDKHTYAHLMAAAVSGMQGPSGDLPSLKRPRNEAEETECMQEHKRRKKAWDTLVNMGKQVFKKSDEYFQAYGRLEEPIDPEVWLDLAKEDQEAEREATTVPGAGKAEGSAGAGKGKGSSSSGTW